MYEGVIHWAVGSEICLSHFTERYEKIKISQKRNEALPHQIVHLLLSIYTYITLNSNRYVPFFQLLNVTFAFQTNVYRTGSTFSIIEFGS